jgi:SAM-dependent methyltransferase
MTAELSEFASREHWDRIYDGACVAHWLPGWKPDGSYVLMVLESVLRREIAQSRAQSILEIGCGNSVWLPYFARELRVAVAGIDRSESGCRLAEENLAASGAKGVIHHRDVLECTAEEIGQFDFVYSLGVVEHFADVRKALSKFAEFVRPGGVLLTEIPNFPSFHSALSRFWQPRVLARHNLSAKGELVPAYGQMGFVNVRERHLGLFSLSVPAWGIDPRFPRLEKTFMPLITRCVRLVDKLLCRTGRYAGGRPYWAPFYYVAGNKPQRGQG